MAGKGKSDLSASLLASFEDKRDPSQLTIKKQREGAKRKSKVGYVEKEAKSASAPFKKASGGAAATALRSTISYQATDADAADKILDLLKQETGARGSFSDAVKIALRLCPSDPKSIRKAWELTKQEDGRVIRHKV